MQLNENRIKKTTHPSIHPSSTNYPGSGHKGNNLSRKAPTSIFVATSSSSFGEMPSRSQASRVTQALQCILSLPSGHLAVLCALTTVPVRHLGGILTSCTGYSKLLTLSLPAFTTWSESDNSELLEFGKPVFRFRKLRSETGPWV